MSNHRDISPIIAIRLAGRDDQDALRRLAALDEAPVPSGPVLLAIVDGEALAALPLNGAAAISDPFRRTADLVELLRARARHLDHPDSSFRGARGLLRRLATRAA